MSLPAAVVFSEMPVDKSVLAGAVICDSLELLIGRPSSKALDRRLVLLPSTNNQQQRQHEAARSERRVAPPMTTPINPPTADHRRNYVRKPCCAMRAFQHPSPKLLRIWLSMGWYGQCSLLYHEAHTKHGLIDNQQLRGAPVQHQYIRESYGHTARHLQSPHGLAA